MGESQRYGSITRGKVANMFVTRPMPSLAWMPYAYQTPVIRHIVLGGKPIKTLQS
jgi:imidazolonepropionase